MFEIKKGSWSKMDFFGMKIDFIKERRLDRFL